jgi:hypothetical protein
MKVLINRDREGRERQEVDAKVIKENSKTIRVMLPNGDVIVRRRVRDLSK